MGVVGSIASGIIGSNATKSAADTQAGATRYAADLVNSQFQQTQNYLAPYRSLGDKGINMLADPSSAQYFTPAAVPGAMTQSALEATPGYQFTQQQGLLATQNAAAAKGLGVSGAALKGAASYATGLADKTYQDQFNIQQQQFTDTQQAQTAAYNRISGLVNTGQTAAAGTATAGANAANTVAGITTSGANAQAASQIAQGNALSGAINNTSNQLNQNYLLSQIYGGGGY